MKNKEEGKNHFYRVVFRVSCKEGYVTLDGGQTLSFSGEKRDGAVEKSISRTQK